MTFKSYQKQQPLTFILAFDKVQYQTASIFRRSIISNRIHICTALLSIYHFETIQDFADMLPTYYVFFNVQALCCLSCKGRAHLISSTQAQCEVCSQVYDCSEQTETLLTSLQSLENLNNLKPKSGMAQMSNILSIL